jgi:hypothetical protein
VSATWPTPIYIAVMLGLIVICSAPPFIIEKIKKPGWKIEHPDTVLLDLDDSTATPAPAPVAVAGMTCIQPLNPLGAHDVGAPRISRAVRCRTEAPRAASQTLSRIVEELVELGHRVVEAQTLTDGRALVSSDPSFGAVVLDWDVTDPTARRRRAPCSTRRGCAATASRSS